MKWIHTEPISNPNGRKAIVTCGLDSAACDPADYYLLLKSRSHITHGEHKGEPRYDPTQHQQYWGSAWDSLTKAAGLGGIRFHDLRHTFITHMVERGVPPRNDSGICGAHEYENAQALHAYHVRRCASHCETVGRRSHPHTREAGKRKGIPCVSYAAFCGGFCGLNHVRQHVRMLQAARNRCLH